MSYNTLFERSKRTCIETSIGNSMKYCVLKTLLQNILNSTRQMRYRNKAWYTMVAGGVGASKDEHPTEAGAPPDVCLPCTDSGKYTLDTTLD
ncbi:unnamed protein product [Colias eurytheme]|nr:unnamed protein product [Colias eurytheme]